MRGAVHGLAVSIALIGVAPFPAAATDIVGLGAEYPRVRFDVPLAVAAHAGADATNPADTTLAPGETLLTVELPFSVVVARGDVHRVGEVVVEVDGSAAGLRVHGFTPMTRLESEFAGDIQIESTNDRDRRFDASLGGAIPGPGAAVAQLAPSISAGRTSHTGETEKAARRAPKEAIVVAGATNRRQGVLFKFRPSSQTTLEGERRLRITFIAPPDFDGGELTVRCHASGERRVLFVKQRRIWGSATEPVSLRVADHRPDSAAASHRMAKPVIDDSIAGEPTASGPIGSRPKTGNKPSPPCAGEHAAADHHADPAAAAAG